LTALVVQELNQTVVIQITNFTPFPPSGAVPLTITYVTTDGTATGRCVLITTGWLKL